MWHGTCNTILSTGRQSRGPYKQDGHCWLVMTAHVHGLPRSVRLYGCAPTVTPRRVVTASKAASYSELWKALSPCSSAHSRLTCAGVGKLALLQCIAKMQILSSPIKETVWRVQIRRAIHRQHNHPKGSANCNSCSHAQDSAVCRQYSNP